MRLHYLQCTQFQFVWWKQLGQVRLTFFFGRCRNMFSGEDISAVPEKNYSDPVEKLLSTPMIKYNGYIQLARPGSRFFSTLFQVHIFERRHGWTCCRRWSRSRHADLRNDPRTFDRRNPLQSTTLQTSSVIITRNLSYRKNDRAMRPIIIWVPWKFSGVPAIFTRFRDIAAFVLQHSTFSHPTSSIPQISTCSPGSRWMMLG